MTTQTMDGKNNPGEDLSQYLREIRAYPRLLPEEEGALARRCAQGDEEAICQMVNSNLRLVVSVAREYAGRGVPMMDLIQEGSIGLLIAAEKYDYTLDFRFSTYASKWIRQRVSRYLMNHKGLIYVPEHTMERIRKVEMARQELTKQMGEEPDTAQIAEFLGITEQRVKDLIALNPEVCSLDVPAVDAERSTLSVLLEDLEAPQPHEELVRRELRQIMERLLGSLNPRQQRVLRMHFGMEDGECHSLEEIGKELGISKERARQIERQAFEHLQKLGAGIGLEDFLNE